MIIRLHGLLHEKCLEQCLVRHIVSNQLDILFIFIIIIVIIDSPFPSRAFNN
jgi:hypothetical protein